MFMNHRVYYTVSNAGNNILFMKCKHFKCMTQKNYFPGTKKMYNKVNLSQTAIARVTFNTCIQHILSGFQAPPPPQKRAT